MYSLESQEILAFDKRIILGRSVSIVLGRGVFPLATAFSPSFHNVDKDPLRFVAPHSVRCLCIASIASILQQRLLHLAARALHV